MRSALPSLPCARGVDCRLPEFLGDPVFFVFEELLPDDGEVVKVCVVTGPIVHVLAKVGSCRCRQIVERNRRLAQVRGV
jgi:hypothetical protein